jgi:RNA polymerase sigma factor (sigma-70 family)
MTSRTSRQWAGNMTPFANRLTEFGLDSSGGGPALAEGPELSEVSAAEHDHALLCQYVQTGSEDAFSRIVYRHSGWVYHTCRRNLQDAHLAEDATQAVFLLLSRKALSIKPETHLGGWLFQACRYVLADIRKSRARYLRRQDLARDLTQQRFSAAQRAEGEPDPVLSAAVDEAIAGLRESDRQTILMHFYEGLTVRQMAAQLSITHEGAKKRVMRALARLRKQLAGKVQRLGGRSILPAAAIILVLRARSAEAAPADLVSAVAKSATIPGLSSTFVEVIVESVCRSAIRATDKLLARLALSALVLSMLIAGSVPLRSLRGGSSGLAAVTGSEASRSRPGAQTGAAKALSLSAKQSAMSALDDADPGPPYTQQTDADAAPLASVDQLVAHAQVSAVPADPPVKAQPAPVAIRLAATAVPMAAASPALAVTVAPAAPVASRWPEPFRSTESAVVIQTAAPAGLSAATRPPSADPRTEDHRLHEPVDAHPRPEQPPLAGVPGGGAPSHGGAPDQPASPPGGPKPVSPAPVVDRAPPPPRYEAPADDRHWASMPSDGDAVRMVALIPADAPRQMAAMDVIIFRTPAIPWKAYAGSLDYEIASAAPGRAPEFLMPLHRLIPSEVALPDGIDPGLPMLAMDGRPLSAWRDGGDKPDDLKSFGDASVDPAWGTPFASGMWSQYPLVADAPLQGDAISVMTDAVIIPEPTSCSGILFMLAALAARRRR